MHGRLFLHHKTSSLKHEFRDKPVLKINRIYRPDSFKKTSCEKLITNKLRSLFSKMYFELFLVFFIRGSFADLCPANWLFEEISGECKQTNIAVVCTGNSLVAVAKVDDLYFNLPTNKESDTRLKIGTCIGATAPMRSQYIARFSINECEPEIAVKDDGIVLSWEVTGTSVSGFGDVFKYSASCEIWTDGSEKKAAEGEFEGITVDNAIIAEIVSESNKVRGEFM